MLSLPAEDRQAWIASLTKDEADELIYRWEFWARDKQVPPAGDWLVWMLMAGRGFGKGRTGAEFVRGRVESGVGRRIALLAQTPADVRDDMIEGEGGILAISPPDNMPHYEPSKRRLTWPNGARATTFSGFHPEQVRGPNIDTAWCDELASWKYARETWDNLMFTLRSGDDPRCVVTTTPKPIKLRREIRDAPTTVVTTGSTYENIENLAPSFFAAVIAKYKDTRTGRQEIYAELLEEAEGALWKRSMIDDHRVQSVPLDEKGNPLFSRVVVALDLATTSGDESNETGIVAVGLGKNVEGYVWKDRSGRYTPDEWARVALALYDEVGADRMVAETNQGGEMIGHTLRTIRPSVSYKGVHASRGKQARAEPVVALYEQGRVHHVGVLAELEDQLVTWEPLSGDASPDRLDAVVWALVELMVTGGVPTVRFM